jgi:hypothetical protein
MILKQRMKHMTIYCRGSDMKINRGTLTSIALLSCLVVGCNNSNGESTDCGDIITLHRNGEQVIVNKDEIIMIEKHGDKSFVSFNHELEKVNGLTRGKGEVFDESLEEVNNLINCKN